MWFEGKDPATTWPFEKWGCVKSLPSFYSLATGVTHIYIYIYHDGDNCYSFDNVIVFDDDDDDDDDEDDEDDEDGATPPFWRQVTHRPSSCHTWHNWGEKNVCQHQSLERNHGPIVAFESPNGHLTLRKNLGKKIPWLHNNKVAKN